MEEGEIKQEEIMEPDAGTPELSALNNHLILGNNFKNLSTSTVLTCRLVNNKWSKIGSDTLKRRPVYARLVLELAENYHEFSRLPPGGNLQELAKILCKESFPATGLEITGGHGSLDLENPTMKAFFNDYGTTFTRVYLSNCQLKLKDTSDIVKLLADNLPNLEEITFYMFGVWGGKKDTVKELHFLKVRQINFQRCRTDTDVVLQILRGAPNLKVFNGLTSGYLGDDTLILEEFRRQDKLGAIASLVLYDSESVELYQSLALVPPALVQLTVNFARWNPASGCEQCLEAILTASGNTLKKLTVQEPQKIVWNNLAAVFTKLHTLKLGDYDRRIYGSDWMESLDIWEVNLAEKFPALKRISLLLQGKRNRKPDLVTGTRKILETHFWKPGTVVNTVDTIELHDHFSPDGIEFLAQVFPNVTQVVINFAHAGYGVDAATREPSDVWYVRKFRSLRKLVIVDFPAASDYLHLDNFLTGIPVSISNVLQKEKKHKFEAPYDRLFRPHGGLWKLRKIGLRELEIQCSLKWYQKPPTMSAVAVWYGLEVIPGLRTTFRVSAKRKDIAEALMAFRPHVSVELYSKD